MSHLCFTLWQVNLVYLGASVLILLDRSYLSRFWTQFEAWLSFMAPSPTGLVSESRAACKRYSIRLVHGAPEKLRESILEEWGQCTVLSAHLKLSSPDVSVTNQRDKDQQLPKILQLDVAIRDHALNSGVGHDLLTSRSMSGHDCDDGGWRARALAAESEVEKLNRLLAQRQPVQVKASNLCGGSKILSAALKRRARAHPPLAQV